MEKDKVTQRIISDYKMALVTMIWSCDYNRRRDLLFASVEMYPNECDIYFDSEETNIHIKKKKIRLFHRRIIMPAQDALRLYCDVDKERKISMTWEDREKYICVSELASFPNWPFFFTSSKENDEFCPFVPDGAGICRLHDKLSRQQYQPLVEICQYENVVKWLQEKLRWNINDFPELIGSIHLILPNPVFRKLSLRIMPNKNKAEKIYGHFFVRDDKMSELKKLNLYTIEKSHVGIMNARRLEINTSDIMLETKGMANEFAYLVESPEYGILDYSGFKGFIRNIKVDMFMHEQKRNVNIVDETGSISSYTVDVMEHMSTIKMGDAEDDFDIGKKIGYHKHKNYQHREAQKSGQHLFVSNQIEEAQNYIRSLFARAKNNVIVLDPYFDSIDFYKFILSIAVHNVSVCIITSSMILKEKDKNYDKPKGEILKEKIDDLNKNGFKNSLSINVMLGKTPCVHDRFLLIDDECYLSGNSLNHIGERASMLIKVPYAQEIINLIENVINSEDCVSFDVWLNNRKDDEE